MADDAENCGVGNVGRERIARRYRDGDGPTVWRSFFDLRSRSKVEAEMGTSEIIEKLIHEIKSAEQRGVTRYQLSQRTGIPQSTLSRLMNRERDSLKVETVEKLCRELGLTIEITGSGTRKGRKE